MTRPLPPHDQFGAAMAAGAPNAPPQMAAAVMAALRAQRLRDQASRPSLWRRWPLLGRQLMLALALLVPVGGTIGVARASAAAWPGDALYGVRLLREQAALALAPTVTARGSLALGYAEDRLAAVHHIVRTYGNLGIALALMGDALRYNRQAARARLPWMRQALAAQVAATARDCNRLTHDPLWQRRAGSTAAERAMDARLDALVRVAHSA